MILPLLLGVELIYASFIPTKQVYLQQFLKNKKNKDWKLEHRFSHRIQMKFNMFCNNSALNLQST